MKNQVIPIDIFKKYCHRDDYKTIKALFDEFTKIHNIKNKYHFLSQVAYESSYFNRSIESMMYSTNRLLEVFPKYFKTPDQAKHFSYKQDKIANKVYGGRMGNDKKGDGWRFIGRGFIQVTGRYNYESMKEFINFDKSMSHFIKYIETERGAMQVSCAWWEKNKVDDLDSVQDVTHRVNGGYNGLKKRIDLYTDIEKCCKPYEKKEKKVQVKTKNTQVNVKPIQEQTKVEPPVKKPKGFFARITTWVKLQCIALCRRLGLS